MKQQRPKHLDHPGDPSGQESCTGLATPGFRSSTILGRAQLLTARCCGSGIVTSLFLTARGWFDARCSLKEPPRPLWWLRMRMKHNHPHFLLSDNSSEVLLWGRFGGRQTRLWRRCRVGLSPWRLQAEYGGRGRCALVFVLESAAKLQ